MHAYLNERFVKGSSARTLRIPAAYLTPKSRFDPFRVDDTTVFVASARIPARHQAELDLKAAEQGEGDLEVARRRLDLSQHQERLIFGQEVQ